MKHLFYLVLLLYVYISRAAGGNIDTMRIVGHARPAYLDESVEVTYITYGDIRGRLHLPKNIAPLKLKLGPFITTVYADSTTNSPVIRTETSFLFQHPGAGNYTLAPAVWFAEDSLFYKLTNSVPIQVLNKYCPLEVEERVGVAAVAHEEGGDLADLPLADVLRAFAVERGEAGVAGEACGVLGVQGLGLRAPRPGAEEELQLGLGGGLAGAQQGGGLVLVQEGEGDEALLGLLGRELHDDGVFVSFAFRFFFFSGIGGFVIFAEAQEYGKGDNQADASHSESPLVRPAEDVDIVGGKRTQGVDSSYRDILVGGQGYQFFISGGAFGEGAALQLVGEGGDFTVVGEVRLVHERFRDLVGHAGSEEGSNVDAHVEDAEGQVPVFAVARRVVKVANEHLQVAFEKARADGDEGKGGNHDGQSASKGEKRVTEEHDDGAERDCFAVAEIFVGDESAKHREKVDRGQKDAEHLSGGGGGPAVPGLKVERENRKHGVVAESFSHVGES